MNLAIAYAPHADIVTEGDQVTLTNGTEGTVMNIEVIAHEIERTGAYAYYARVTIRTNEGHTITIID